MRWLFVVLAVALAALAAPARAAPKLPRWQTLPLPPAMPKATTSGHVEVGGAKIFYATYGAGAPVILLHGGLGNGEQWAFQVPALAEKFRVIAIDSRGQGRSTLGKRKLGYRAMAGDVLAVMDHLAVERAAFVGWSDGGAIALDLAIHHPARVGKLFVLGTNYHASGSKPRKGPSARTFTSYAAKCRRDYQRLATSPKAHDAALAALLPVWRAPGGFTQDQLRAIRAPTVVADGDHDEIIRLDHVREMADLIPGAKLVVFEDTSHFALWQAPDAVTRAIVDFLTAP